MGNPGYDAMIDQEAYLSDLVFAVWFAATDFAICADQVGWKWITQTFYSDASYQAREEDWSSGVRKCSDEALETLWAVQYP